MKTLVTGGTGFIGSRLIPFLISKGHNVRALCRPSSDVSVFSEHTAHIFRGDILDRSSVEQAVDGCDSVFHLAGYARNWARDPQVFFDVNVTGTDNVLRAASEAGAQKVIVTSTCMTFGTSCGRPHGETEQRNEDFCCDYERSKYHAEQQVERYVRSGLSAVIVNPTRIFGPGLLREGNAVTKMIKLYLGGVWRLILGDGSAVGNYVYIDDVVRGHWLALERGRAGEKYILGGENLSYNMFFECLGAASGKNRKMIHVPLGIGLKISRVAELLGKWFGIYPFITPDWVRLFSLDWEFSSEKAQEEINYVITPFDEALEKTLLWLRELRHEKAS
jgi:nucleoside-diphosphate-sugar epimerase